MTAAHFAFLERVIEPQDLDFPPIDFSELSELRLLAKEIWNLVYPAVIGQAQIDYMLGEMYSEEALAPQLSGQGNTGFRWIVLRGEYVGFYSTMSDPERGSVFLDKLYLHPDQHRQGIGRAALEHIAAKARTAGSASIRLRVNRDNTTALAVYGKVGFKKVGELCVDIGGGFAMDDFWLEWTLEVDG